VTPSILLAEEGEEGKGKINSPYLHIIIVYEENQTESDVVAHNCNPSTQEAEAPES
jgi:hypothetical protein